MEEQNKPVNSNPESKHLVTGESSPKIGDITNNLNKLLALRTEDGLKPKDSTSEQIIAELNTDPLFEGSFSSTENFKDTQQLEEIADLSRENIALDPKTSLEVLNVLAQDESVEVRRKVAMNTSASTELLETLTKDEDKWVAENAKVNLETPKGETPNFAMPSKGLMK
jgi:hypothetical protein